jgi:hypothetical protein
LVALSIRFGGDTRRRDRLRKADDVALRRRWIIGNSLKGTILGLGWWRWRWLVFMVAVIYNNSPVFLLVAHCYSIWILERGVNQNRNQ